MTMVVRRATISVALLIAVSACGGPENRAAAAGSAPGSSSAAAAGSPAARAETAAPTDSADSVITRSLAERFPTLELLGFGRTTPLPPITSAATIPFRTRGAEWPYGTLLVIWEQPAKILWTLQVNGDTGPHAIQWFDANSDGRADLFFHAGEEEVHESHLFVRSASDAAGDSAFVRAIRDETQYLTVLDLDRDGRLEFLGGAFVVDSGGMDDAAVCSDVDSPSWVSDTAAAHYRAAEVGASAGNFDSGYDHPYALMLHARQPLAIWQVQGARKIDVTRRFPNELRWRLRLAEELLAKKPDAPCVALLENVARHLRAHLS